MFLREPFVLTQEFELVTNGLPYLEVVRREINEIEPKSISNDQEMTAQASRSVRTYGSRLTGFPQHIFSAVQVVVDKVFYISAHANIVAWRVSRDPKGTCKGYLHVCRNLQDVLNLLLDRTIAENS